MSVQARLATLAEIEAAAWYELARAVSDRQHGWRTPVLATADGDGGADARTVVLREVDASSHTLVFFTDRRAAKVAQMRTTPRGTLLFWSPSNGWQLRCAVKLHVDDQGLPVASRWAAIKQSAAAGDYLSPHPPGTPLDEPAPASVRKENFAVVTAAVQSIDWLELHAEGHRRARFSSNGARWVQP